LNRRLLTGITIAVVGLGLIILGIFAISRIVRQSFAPLPAPTAIPELTTDVVVTTRDVALGSVLSSEDLEVVEMPVGTVPRNALGDTELALGRITTVHLIEGEMVLEHHLADPTNIAHDVGYVIGNDQVLMAFPADDLMSTINILQRGDVIDLLVSSVQNIPVQEIGPDGEPIEPAPGEEPQTEDRLFTWDVLQKIQISAVVVEIINQEENAAQQAGQNVAGQPQPTPLPQDVRVQAYLLALNPQDALILKNLIDSGAKFDIVLRSPTSNELFGLTPVTSEYLIEKFQLEISR
jgi:Flp pilus assembly protein CpaB